MGKRNCKKNETRQKAEIAKARKYLKNDIRNKKGLKLRFVLKSSIKSMQ